MSLPKIIAVLGPTASGKTSLAIDIAVKFGGEIVNCDSRQIYREMVIGTAAPTKNEMVIVPHHLFGFLSPDQSFSAGDYINLAWKKILEINLRRKITVLVGGTGLYFDALIHGLPKVEQDVMVRENLLKKLNAEGLNSLIKEISERDPDALKIIDLNNPRRVVRALELLIASGMKFSEVRKREPLFQANVITVKVTLPRTLLRTRIHMRTDSMICAGLQEEVAALISKYGRTAPALTSIGYREWLDFFDKKIALSAVVEKIKIHTCQYAKRQETWFRNKLSGNFFDLSKPDSCHEIFKYISKNLQNLDEEFTHK